MVGIHFDFDYPSLVGKFGQLFTERRVNVVPIRVNGFKLI